jgi:acetyltransferase-like isoleucine patch superfamily enzyme
MLQEDTETLAKIPLREQLSDTKISSLKRYQDKVFKGSSLSGFIYYELANLLFSNLPSSVGYLGRKLFFKRIFRHCGQGVILGKGITLRNPKFISLGDRVVIDDFSLLDGSGAGEAGVELGDDVLISRNALIQGKTGAVKLGNGTNIGCNVVISSATGIYIGNSVLIASNCYIGGAGYFSDRIDIPIMEQGLYSKGPIIIGDDVWLGAGATVLDGVKIGRGCIVGAGALVTKDLPDFSVAVGVPAKIVKIRE